MPAIPLLCWAYLAWDLYAPPLPRATVPLGLFLATVAFFPQNWDESRSGVRGVRDRYAEFEADVRKGSHPYEIASRHSKLIYGADDPITYVESLRKARIRPFDQLREDPKFREVAVPVAPLLIEHASWDEASKTLAVEGRDSRATFALPEPIKVAGIRMGYSLDGPQGSGRSFVFSWRATKKDPWAEGRTFKDASVRISIGDGRETTFWVDDTVGQFRIEPDAGPCKFQVHSITLLVP